MARKKENTKIQSDSQSHVTFALVPCSALHSSSFWDHPNRRQKHPALIDTCVGNERCSFINEYKSDG